MPKDIPDFPFISVLPEASFESKLDSLVSFANGLPATEYQFNKFTEMLRCLKDEELNRFHTESRYTFTEAASHISKLISSQKEIQDFKVCLNRLEALRTLEDSVYESFKKTLDFKSKIN